MVNNLTKVSIPPYSKLKIEWSDKPENYSRAAKTRIINHFAKKYGVNKSNISIVYKAVKFDNKGNTIEITGANIENIMDVNYQRSLMKELITRDNKTVDFNRIIALDDKVNAELNIDLTVSQHRNWSLKWLMLDNFLAFGEKNYIPFNKLKGLTIVNSIPSNQGGKTSLTIDAIQFLLFGTTTKTDTNEQVFNTFSDKNELIVRGMIDIESDEIIIERKMKRSPKKGGTWTVTNKLNYYRILPDGEEELLNEEDSKQSTKKIKETVGSEKDFELLVLANEKNLDDLIGLSPTESSKVLTRLIGLEILDLKEAAVRVMYNEFAKKKKSNEYDVITLTDEIESHKEKIILNTELKTELTNTFDKNVIEINNLNIENDRLLNSKENVDVTIFELNPGNLENEIEKLIKDGVAFKSKVVELELKIKEIGVVNFDEDNFVSLTKEYNQNITDKALKEAEHIRLIKVIDGLIAGGICQSCNRKLDKVDNSAHITKHELEVNNLKNEIFNLDGVIDSINIKLKKLGEDKKLIDNKNRLELDKDRIEVEIGSLRNIILGKKNDLKKYSLNLSAIEFNKKIDLEVAKIKTDLVVAEYSKTDCITKIERVSNDINFNSNNILIKEKLIETIKKEEEVDKIYKIYIELVGKKGISKLVLRSVLPIINSELERILDGVCDFEIEIFIDDKNNIQFLIIKDGVVKQLKSGSGLEKTASSLALRCVLGKISTLPMPNFITFDEVLGKIAPENLDNIKMLFDKIKDMYEIVFFLTHNDLVKDWNDNIITVVKTNNISNVRVK